MKDKGRQKNIYLFLSFCEPRAPFHKGKFSSQMSLRENTRDRE